MANETPGQKLRVDPIACEGHGLCIEAFPEWISADPWGYPVLSAESIPRNVMKHAGRAVAVCPVLALRIFAETGTPAGR